MFQVYAIMSALADERGHFCGSMKDLAIRAGVARSVIIEAVHGAEGLLRAGLVSLLPTTDASRFSVSPFPRDTRNNSANLAVM